MTLIDLQGKALYSGDKEVQKAYLNGSPFYKKLQTVNPLSYVGNPEYVIDFTTGAPIAYLTGNYTIESFMKSPSGKEPIQTNEGLVFSGNQYLINKSVASFSSGMFEVTVKLDKSAIVALNTILGVFESGRDNRKRVLGVTTPNQAVLFSGYSTTRLTTDLPNTDKVTFVIIWNSDSSSDNHLYINGEYIGYSYIARDSGIDTLGIGASNSTGSSAYAYLGRFTLLNIKHYSSSNRLTDEQINESYTNQL